MSHRLSDKAIACLVIASQPPLSKGWGAAMAGAERHFGKKPIAKKFAEMQKRGYIASDSRTGWLTTKGKAALAAENQP